MRIIRYHNSPGYNPAANFATLREEMDNLFSAAFPSLGWSPSDGNNPGRFPVDFYQDKTSFILRAELPGFRKEDLNVEVADGTLTVTGHEKAEPAKDAQPDDKEAPVAVQERRITRSVSLPEEVEVEGIQAVYENGILTVTVPKKAKTEPRKVAIEIK